MNIKRYTYPELATDFDKEQQACRTYLTMRVVQREGR